MGRVLVFGSLNLDDVYRVDHFVRPGESLIARSYKNFPGGKGLNQAVAAARSGASTFISGKIGADGARLQEALRENKIDMTHLDVTGSRTGRAIIQVDDGGQNSILVDTGANGEIETEKLHQTIASFGASDVLVTQNETSQTVELLRAAYGQGMQIALNPSPINERLKDCDLAHVTWLFINEIEGQALTEESVPEKITALLHARYPALKIILTLGKEGVRYHDQEQILTHGIYPVDPVDTTAAGDTFTGFFLGAQMQGTPLPQALEMASIASSIAVSRMGAACSIPTMEEVLTYYKHWKNG